MSRDTACDPLPSVGRPARATLGVRRSASAVIGRVLERPALYRLWQRPFVYAKFAPIGRHNDLGAVRRVLDVGCGPGTNAGWFRHARYTGIDLNPAYVAYARQRYRGDFVVADVRGFVPPDGARFDFVLANSLLHHLDDDACRELLPRLAGCVSTDGHVHILELVSARRPTPAWLLARLDRGSFTRSRETWLGLFGEVLAPVVCESYAVPAVGPTLWNMLYFKGRPLAAAG